MLLTSPLSKMKIIPAKKRSTYSSSGFNKNDPSSEIILDFWLFDQSPQFITAKNTQYENSIQSL